MAKFDFSVRPSADLFLYQSAMSDINWTVKSRESGGQSKKSRGFVGLVCPASTIVKVSPTTLTIKEPEKLVVKLHKSDIAKFGSQFERQTPLKVYVDRQGLTNWRRNNSKAT